MYQFIQAAPALLLFHSNNSPASASRAGIIQALDIMRNSIKPVAILTAGLIAASASAFAETASDLWRDGHRITWESAYESVEECTPDNGVVLSNEFIFICDSYENVYHYGAVLVASKTFTYNGRTLTTHYLCLEDEDECLSGALVRRR